MKQFVLIGKDGKYEDLVDPVGRVYIDKGILKVEQDSSINPRYTYEFPIDSRYEILEFYYDDEELCYVYEDEKRAKELGLL